MKKADHAGQYFNISLFPLYKYLSEYFIIIKTNLALILTYLNYGKNN